MMKTIFGFIVVAGFVAGGSGCSIVDTGPKVVQTAVSGTTAVGKTLLSQYAPKYVTAGASAKVSDPRYRVQTFVGSGVLVDMLISLEGADVGFDIQSGGEGGGGDAELKAELIRTWADPNATEAEKQKRIESIILNAIQNKSVGGSGPPAANDNEAPPESGNESGPPDSPD